MKKNSSANLCILLIIAVMYLPSFGCINKNKHMIKEETVNYTVEGKTMKGFAAFPTDSTTKKPAIIIVPEWWGVNDYVKNRARQLADSGFVAFVADMFGNGKIAATPNEAMSLTSKFYKDPRLALTYVNAALQEIKKINQTDKNNIAAIGYCFGGYIVLNAAKLGSDLKGIVSFHGGLGGVLPDKNLLKAKMLICHGDSDRFVTQKDVDLFKHQMDSIKAEYSYKSYANATHAFTNPESNSNAKKFNMPIAYNPAADTASWKDMWEFFGKIFTRN